jgi:hypothetical protein
MENETKLGAMSLQSILIILFNFFTKRLTFNEVFLRERLLYA